MRGEHLELSRRMENRDPGGAAFAVEVTHRGRGGDLGRHSDVKHVLAPLPEQRVVVGGGVEHSLRLAPLRRLDGPRHGQDAEQRVASLAVDEGA